jgi:HD-like signal output (HDOD) protein
MLSAEEYALRATQSFTLPQTCVQLRRLLDNDKSDSNDIAKIISNDPVLGAKLLKLANSALFRFEYQIDDIDKAITVVGGEALYNLMMAETASSAFEHFSNDAIDLQRFGCKVFTLG